MCTQHLKDGLLHSPSPETPAITCFYDDCHASKTDYYNMGERCNAGNGTPHQVTYDTGGLAQSGINCDGASLKVIDVLEVRRLLAAARDRKLETLMSNAKDVVLMGKSGESVVPDKVPNELSR